VTAVFAAHGHLGSAAGMTAGYRPAMVVSAVISLVGAVAAIAVGRRASAVAGSNRGPRLVGGGGRERQCGRRIGVSRHSGSANGVRR